MNIFDDWDIDLIDARLSEYTISWNQDMECKACIFPEDKIMMLHPAYSDLATSIMHELGHDAEYRDGLEGRLAHHEIEEMAVEFIEQHPEAREYLDDYVTRI